MARNRAQGGRPGHSGPSTPAEVPREEIGAPGGFQEALAACLPHLLQESPEAVNQAHGAYGGPARLVAQEYGVFLGQVDAGEHARSIEILDELSRVCVSW